MSVAGALTTQTSLVQHDDVPWVWMGYEGTGVEMKLLRCGRDDDVCTFLNRFHPGFQAPRHLHLGEVHAYTLQGRWHYLEYDWESKAGDYVYEPPGTTHTLNVPEDNTELTIVFFTLAKGMELYDENGEVFMMQDAKGLEELYRGGLAEKGLSWPEAILP